MPMTKVSVQSAIIGGSVGYRFLKDRWKGIEALGAVCTPFGDSAPVYRGESDGVDFLYISRHGESGYNVIASFVNYRANIWALKEFGVERIVAWSGPAAIDMGISIGEVLVPVDIVDETKRRDYTYFEGQGLGFVRQNPVFCPELRASLAEVVRERFGECRMEDIYVCTEGPRLETPAEIHKFASYGGTLVGMTLVPEVFLARELEMCYCPVCYITNYAEGLRKRSFRPGVLFEGLLDDEEIRAVDAGVVSAADAALRALVSVATKGRGCHCGQTMERYRRRGDIGDDWRQWVKRP